METQKFQAMQDEDLDARQRLTWILAWLVQTQLKLLITSDLARQCVCPESVQTYLLGSEEGHAECFKPSRNTNAASCGGDFELRDDENGTWHGSYLKRFSVRMAQRGTQMNGMAFPSGPLKNIIESCKGQGGCKKQWDVSVGENKIKPQIYMAFQCNTG